MLLTPRIVRSHELTATDLAPDLHRPAEQLLARAARRRSINGPAEPAAARRAAAGRPATAAPGPVLTASRFPAISPVRRQRPLPARPPPAAAPAAAASAGAATPPGDVPGDARGAAAAPPLPPGREPTPHPRRRRHHPRQRRRRRRRPGGRGAAGPAEMRVGCGPYTVPVSIHGARGSPISL